MTRARAKELLPVIQAYVEGKAVQYRAPNIAMPWQDLGQLQASCLDGDCEYRVKPEPRVWYVWVCENTAEIHGMHYQDAAQDYVNRFGSGRKLIKVQEVL